MHRVLSFLIVDDDNSQLHLMRAILVELQMPHECHYVSNGQDALDFLHRKPPYEQARRPDLILLDLNMPGMSGFEVLRSIKTDDRLRNIPTIILSGSQASKDVNTCYGEYANAYIHKPTDLLDSIKVLEQIDRFWSHVAVPEQSF